MMEYTIAEKISKIPKWTEYCRNCKGINTQRHGYFCSMSCANVYFYSEWVSRLLTKLENSNQEYYKFIMEKKQ